MNKDLEILLSSAKVLSRKGINELIPKLNNIELMKVYENKDYLVDYISNKDLIELIIENKNLSKENFVKIQSENFRKLSYLLDKGFLNSATYFLNETFYTFLIFTSFIVALFLAFKISQFGFYNPIFSSQEQNFSLFFMISIFAALASPVAIIFGLDLIYKKLLKSETLFDNEIYFLRQKDRDFFINQLTKHIDQYQ